MGMMDHSAHRHGEEGNRLMIGASILLAILLLNGLYISYQAKKREQKRTLNTHQMTIKTFVVEGMTCKNCKAHVEKDIKNLAGIDDAIADLATGEVNVSGNGIDIEKVKLAVEQGGLYL